MTPRVPSASANCPSDPGPRSAAQPVEQSLLWRWLSRRAFGEAVLAVVEHNAVGFTGTTEPQRLRTLRAAWDATGDAADGRLRRRWLRRLGAHIAAKVPLDELMAMRLVELPHAGPGLSKCHPDLAIVTLKRGSLDDPFSARRATVVVHVVIEAKVRQRAKVNAVELRAVYGSSDPSAAAPEIQARMWLHRGVLVIDQLHVYRWAPERVYPPDWDISDAVFALLTPGCPGDYTAPDGWTPASLEALVTLLLADGCRRADPALLAPAAALMAPSGTYAWRGVTPAGRTNSYKTFGVARSFRIWKGELLVIYRTDADFGLTLTARGWWPATLDGTLLDPASLPAASLDSYAATLMVHGDRAGWLPCRWEGCGAGPGGCEHVDKWGSEATTSPAMSASRRRPTG